MMRKICFVLLVSILSSCSNTFLELYPETSLNEGNFYKSETEFILLANGCYVPLRNNEKVEHWIIAEMQSDNSSFQRPLDGGNWARSVVDEFQAAPNNANYSTFWVRSYNGITRCNKLLAEIDRPEVTWSKKGYKDRSKGEALFLRALYYFNLVRQFGGVPLTLDPITSVEAVGIKRSTEEQVYANIIRDLKEAITHFAAAKDLDENGRANEGAAQTLLGKVYLTIKQYKDAETTLKAVIDGGKYALLPSYAALFNPSVKDFKETIFAVQYSENSAELSNQFIFIFAPWTSGGSVTKRTSVSIANSGSGWNQPTKDLVDAFETGDKRKDVSIGIWTGKDWDGEVRDIPYCKKFQPPVSAPDNRCGDNMPILRYSDVLLMYAEALNAQERTGEAIPFVQKVRDRAGLTTPIAVSSKTAVETIIAKERQLEFCFENQRWYDLKRTGKALEVMAAHGKREKALRAYLTNNAFELAAFKLLAPIPVEQILINKLEQNPGY